MALTDDWPPIICGPILRRVEKDSVSVFVALSENSKVHLSVHKMKATGASVVPTKIKDIGINNKFPKKLGENLYVLVLTVALTSDLKSGDLYGYDLSFDTGEDLASLGLLNGTNAQLGYVSGSLPTFSYSPAKIEDLKIVHGSCRKPHAFGNDMLATLDKLIGDSWSQPDERPHQLFLTGDQIYADDVAPSLLKMAGAVGSAALKWGGSGAPFADKEEIPGVKTGVVTALDLLLEPEKRQEIILDKAKMTSTAAASHLVSYAEFLGMYLLVWSDVLWNKEPGLGFNLPTGGAVQSKVFKDSHWDKSNEEKKTEYDNAVKNLNKTHPAVINFSKSLPAVRRALANVPTYMIFDDHEITDDWNISGPWNENVHQSLLGNRILQNALSSYAVFQTWGNDPDHFKSGQIPTRPGSDLLTALGNWKGETDFSNLPLIRAILGIIPPTDTFPGVTPLKWDYEVLGANHHAIVIDTRTQRYYPGFKPSDPLTLPNPISYEDFEASGLIRHGVNDDGIYDVNDDEIKRQISDRRLTNVDLTVLVSPAPVFGHPFLENVMQPLQKFFYGPLVADWEAWAGNRNSYEKLLEVLSLFKSVLILSGDVHYGFTAVVDYWNNRNPSKKTIARFVQCTSSSLKNEEMLTKILGLDENVFNLPPFLKVIVNAPGFNKNPYGRAAKIAVNIIWGVDVLIDTSKPSSFGYFGWEDPGPHLETFSVDREIKGKPAMVFIPFTKTLGWSVKSPGPNWKYRVEFLKNSATRPGVSSQTAAGKFAKNLEQADIHQNQKTFFQMEQVVGSNNLCAISFEKKNKKLYFSQSFWFFLGQPPGPGVPPDKPYTIHEGSLDLVVLGAPEPELGDLKFPAGQGN